MSELSCKIKCSVCFLIKFKSSESCLSLAVVKHNVQVKFLIFMSLLPLLTYFSSSYFYSFSNHITTFYRGREIVHRQEEHCVQVLLAGIVVELLDLPNHEEPFT